MTKLVNFSWTEGIEAWAEHARAAGAPNTTIKTRIQNLRHAARGLEGSPWDVSAEELLKWFSCQDWSLETRRGRKNTLLAFYRWAVETGKCENNPADKLPKIRAGQAKARPAPDEVYGRALMVAPDRERLMLRLAAEHGLRRAEVAQGHSRDLFEDLAGWSLTVHGKGGKTRDIPLTNSLATELRSLPKGFFFPGDDAGHLSPAYVGKRIAKIMPGQWTMHTLRHRFATKAFAVDRDVFTVQELLGHASPATTRIYVQIPNEALRTTVNAVSA